MLEARILVNQRWVDALVNEENIKYAYPTNATVRDDDGSTVIHQAVHAKMVDGDWIIIEGTLVWMIRELKKQDVML